jgi:hypothetical protein
MNCDSTREGLSALIDGALASPQRAAVEAHLAGCAGCRARRREIADLRELMRALQTVDPPGAPDMARRVLAEVRDRRRRSFALAAGLGGIVLAGCVVAAAALRNRGPAPAEPRAPVPASVSEAPAASPPSPPPDTAPADPPPPGPEPGEKKVIGFLEVLFADSAVRLELEQLFRTFPGEFRPESLDSSSGAEGVRIVFEGFAGPLADRFLHRLIDFSRTNASRLRSWSCRWGSGEVGETRAEDPDARDSGSLEMRGADASVCEDLRKVFAEYPGEVEISEREPERGLPGLAITWSGASPKQAEAFRRKLERFLEDHPRGVLKWRSLEGTK